MQNNLQSIIGGFQNFILCLILCMAVVTILTLIGVQRFHLGNTLIGWYAIFISSKSVRPVIVTLLFVRLFTYVAFIFTIKNLTLEHILVYLITVLLINLLILRINHILYDLCFSGAALGVVYLLYLLSNEIQKAEVLTGMYFLYVITILFLIGIAICQFFLGLYQMIIRKKYKTETDLGLNKIKIILIPIMVIFILLPVYMIKKIDYIQTDTITYQLKEGKKKEYPALSRITKADVGCLIDVNGESIRLEDTPLYFKNQDKVLFTKTYSIVQTRGQVTNRVNPMSILSWQDESFQVKNGTSVVMVESFFLFDGKDTYYFPSNTKIEWNNQVVTINSFCEIEVKYNQSIKIYDLEKEEYTEYETGNCYCIATMNGNEQVNLSTDILYRDNGQEQMLFLQPGLLEDLK